MTNILDFTLSELTAWMAALGEPAFRARQVFQWLWQKGARNFGEMSSLSKALREKLAEHAAIVWPEVEVIRESRDGTLKMLLRMADGAAVESVLIPDKEHVTQCLSSQVGCALGCVFCATGSMGFTRNLTHAELCGQVLAGRAELARRGRDGALRNLVFMGMGEPLLNLDNLLRALDTMNEDHGFGFSSRRITVSTAGVPGRLASLGLAERAILAVSLHAPTQELREQLMPTAAKALPLDRLLAELKAYPLRHRQRITIEYILLAGINDSDRHARELVRLLSHLKAKVNLIAANPAKGSPFQPPSMERIIAFENLVRGKGLTVTLRKSKGQDIEAACGQLAAQRQDGDPSPGQSPSQTSAQT